MSTNIGYCRRMALTQLSQLSQRSGLAGQIAQCRAAAITNQVTVQKLLTVAGKYQTARGPCCARATSEPVAASGGYSITSAGRAASVPRRSSITRLLLRSHHPDAAHLALLNEVNK